MRRTGAGLAALFVVLAGCQQSDPPPATRELPFEWSAEWTKDPKAAAKGVAPTQELGPLDVAGLRRILRTDRPIEGYEFTVTAAYPSAEAANQATPEVRGVATRYPRSRGVVRIGPLLVVRGIATRAAAKAAGALLEAPGVKVVVFDVPSENSATLDLSCHPIDRAAAKTFASDVDDYLRISQFHPRPPWVDPPVSDDERRARSTVRRIPQRAHEKAQSDPEFKRAGRELWNSSGDPDIARKQAIGERMAKRLRELQPEVVDDSMDAEVAALFVSQPPLNGSNLTKYFAWSRAVGERLGEVPLRQKEEYFVPAATKLNSQTAFPYDARLGDRLDIATLWSQQSWPAPLAALLLKFAAIGCDDVRYALFDYVDVRRD